MLYRVRITRYTIDGKSVPKGTKNAKKTISLSKKWYGRIRVGWRRKAFPLHIDKQTASKMYRCLVVNQFKIALGVTERSPEADKPIQEHVQDFLTDLASRGKTQQHSDTMRRMLDAFIEHMKLKTLDDVTVSKLDLFLTSKRNEGRSSRTINSYRQAAIALMN